MKQQAVRGIAGFGLLGAAVYALTKDDYGVALVCAALAFISLRGCPSCWLADTYEAAKKTGAPQAEDKPDEPQQG